MKYVYRLLPQHAAISFYSSLKAIERELETHCQLHGNRKLVKQKFQPTNQDENAKWMYECQDTKGEYTEFLADKIEAVHHMFFVERIEVLS
ncbi:hypothetical protein [Acinetobacter sp.]|uniref:hypothetical protein n=1 Tax=Acinetobacter sp. TaxID=472 RepID=UPI003D026195